MSCWRCTTASTPRRRSAPNGCRRCASALRGSVDLVLGGHTLNCFAGTLAGVPFLQPWAFGSQVGVADLQDDGRVQLRLLDAGPARPWAGAGAAAQAALEGEVVGRLERPLLEAAGRESTLARAIGDGVLRSDGQLDRSTSVPATSGTSRPATASTPTSARATSPWRRSCA